MRVTITGATGLIGPRLVLALTARGDDVAVLSRNPAKASERLGVEAVEWDPAAGPAPVDGYDAVVHLAGEPVAQRWSEDAKRRIRESRIAGTTNLVAGIRAAERRPQTLVCASAVGYYGPRGDEPIDEDTPAGDDFLATVCVGWDRRHAAPRSTACGWR